MKPGLRAGGSVPSQSLRDRLAAFSRYAALVREQIEAVHEEDLSRFDELAMARSQVQAELDALPLDPLAEGGAGSGGRELLMRINDQVREALARDKELLALIASKRATVAEQLRSMSGREGKIRKYLVGEDPGPLEAPARLNIRL